MPPQFQSTLAIALAILVAGCAGGPGEDGGSALPGDFSQGVAEAPHVSVGDRWRLASDPDASQANWWMEKEVVEQADHSFQGKTIPSLRFQSRIEVQEGRTRVVTDLTEWRRASDLALLQDAAVSDVTLDGQATGRIQTTRVMDEPCVQVKWPLAAGARWSITCEHSQQSSREGTPGLTKSRGTLKAGYQVGEPELVTVPAGSFEAFPLSRADANGESTEWFASRACATVQARGGQGDAALLESFVCAMPPK